MFDLEQQLSKWRSQMLAGDACLPDDIDELEAHVLDAMGDLESKGLTQEEAFWVAVHRMGDAKSLNGEFRKINGGLAWRRLIVWLLSGYIIVSAISFAMAAVSRLVFLSGFMGGLETSVLTPVNVILRSCLMGGVLFFLFSKKAGNLSIIKQSMKLARNHYLMFLLPLLAVMPIGKVLLDIFAARTLGRHGLQLFLTDAYLNGIWLLLLYISFPLLIILFRRSRKVDLTAKV